MDKGMEGTTKMRGFYRYGALAALLIFASACLCGPLSNLPSAVSGGAATPTLMSLDGSTDGGSGGGDGEAFNFVSPEKSSLKSFRAKFVMTYSGTKEDGTPVEGTFTMDQAHTSDPVATDMSWVGEGTAIEQDKAGNMHIVQVGDASYVVTTVDGVEKCITMSANGLGGAAASPMASPDAMLGSSDLSKARRILPDEVVNGVLSQHYQFTKSEVSLMDASWTNYTVDAWVAVDGGYAVKSTFVGDGDNISYTGGKGHVEWTFDLLEVNPDITITPPEGCDAAAGGDFPKMADASNTFAMEGIITYQSASSINDVVAFYQAELPAQGWTAGEASTDIPGMASLEFTKDGKTASISILGGDGKTTVSIQIK